MKVISDREEFERCYPCYAAVDRAAAKVPRHAGRVIWLEYEGENDKLTLSLDRTAGGLYCTWTACLLMIHFAVFFLIIFSIRPALCCAVPLALYLRKCISLILG